jgi:hypothetical protein
MKLAMATIAAIAVFAMPVYADMVTVTVTGSVEWNQVTFGQFAAVSTGDPVVCDFLVDSNQYTNSTQFNTRGYDIVHSSFVLSLGSVVVGLQDPFPAGETPFFVLRDNDPAVDGFFVSRNVDWPTGVPTSEPGGIDPFFTYGCEIGYTGDTLSSLDILDAVGTYDYNGLTNFYFVILDAWAEPIGLLFEQLSISTAVPVEAATWGGVKSLYR